MLGSQVPIEGLRHPRVLGQGSAGWTCPISLLGAVFGGQDSLVWGWLWAALGASPGFWVLG